MSTARKGGSCEGFPSFIITRHLALGPDLQIMMVLARILTLRRSRLPRPSHVSRVRNLRHFRACWDRVYRDLDLIV